MATSRLEEDTLRTLRDTQMAYIQEKLKVNSALLIKDIGILDGVNIGPTRGRKLEIEQISRWAR